MDGFVFKRKRTVPEVPASTRKQHQSADKKQKLLVNAQDAENVPPDAAATPVASQSAAKQIENGADMAAVKTPDAHTGSAATTALLQQLPSDLSEADRLASLCELLCAAELDGMSTSSAAEQQLEPAVADAVQDVLSRFVRSVQSSAAAGRFQVMLMWRHTRHRGTLELCHVAYSMYCVISSNHSVPHAKQAVEP